MWALTLMEFLPLHLLVVVVIERVGVLLWRVFPAESPENRLRTLIWAPLMLGGYFAGGFLCWGINPSVSYPTVMQAGGYGIVAGQGCGHLISWFLWKYYRREIEGDEDAR